MPEKSIEYIRVSTVLNPFSGLQNINPDILQHAAERGTKVHKICEGIISGIGEYGVDEETKPYVESFKLWWEEGKDVVSIEQRFYCDKHKLTGQVDLIINTPEGMAIVDIKTSSKPSKTWSAQGSAYYYLACKAGLPIKKVYFLHLSKKGGKPKLIEYEPDPSFFLSILQIYNYFFSRTKDE